MELAGSTAVPFPAVTPGRADFVPLLKAGAPIPHGGVPGTLTGVPALPTAPKAPRVMPPAANSFNLTWSCTAPAAPVKPQTRIFKVADLVHAPLIIPGAAALQVGTGIPFVAPPKGTDAIVQAKTTMFFVGTSLTCTPTIAMDGNSVMLKLSTSQTFPNGTPAGDVKSAHGVLQLLLRLVRAVNLSPWRRVSNLPVGSSLRG